MVVLDVVAGDDDDDGPDSHYEHEFRPPRGLHFLLRDFCPVLVTLALFDDLLLLNERGRPTDAIETVWGYAGTQWH